MMCPVAVANEVSGLKGRVGSCAGSVSAGDASDTPTQSTMPTNERPVFNRISTFPYLRLLHF